MLNEKLSHNLPLNKWDIRETSMHNMDKRNDECISDDLASSSQPQLIPNTSQPPEHITETVLQGTTDSVLQDSQSNEPSGSAETSNCIVANYEHDSQSLATGHTTLSELQEPAHPLTDDNVPQYSETPPFTNGSPPTNTNAVSVQPEGTSNQLISMSALEEVSVSSTSAGNNVNEIHTAHESHFTVHHGTHFSDGETILPRTHLISSVATHDSVNDSMDDDHLILTQNMDYWAHYQNVNNISISMAQLESLSDMHSLRILAERVAEYALQTPTNIRSQFHQSFISTDHAANNASLEYCNFAPYNHNLLLNLTRLSLLISGVAGFPWLWEMPSQGYQDSMLPNTELLTGNSTYFQHSEIYHQPNYMEAANAAYAGWDIQNILLSSVTSAEDNTDEVHEVHNHAGDPDETFFAQHHQIPFEDYPNLSDDNSENYPFALYDLIPLTRLRNAINNEGQSQTNDGTDDEGQGQTSDLPSSILYYSAAGSNSNYQHTDNPTEYLLLPMDSPLSRLLSSIDCYLSIHQTTDSEVNPPSGDNSSNEESTNSLIMVIDPLIGDHSQPNQDFHDIDRLQHETDNTDGVDIRLFDLNDPAILEFDERNDTFSSEIFIDDDNDLALSRWLAIFALLVGEDDHNNDSHTSIASDHVNQEPANRDSNEESLNLSEAEGVEPFELNTNPDSTPDTQSDVHILSTNDQGGSENLLDEIITSMQVLSPNMDYINPTINQLLPNCQLGNDPERDENPRNNDIRDVFGAYGLHTAPDQIYSTKIFLGGVPKSISKEDLIGAFHDYGNVSIESGRNGSNAVFVIMESEEKIHTFLNHCLPDPEKDGAYNYEINIKSQLIIIQVIPWKLEMNYYIRDSARDDILDPSKAVFIQSLHGSTHAKSLAESLTESFGEVIFSQMFVDIHNYPAGCAQVTFANLVSSKSAIYASSVQIITQRISKRAKLKPFFLNAKCSICKLLSGPYFCHDVSCLTYFCGNCWLNYHINKDMGTHILVRENNCHNSHRHTNHTMVLPDDPNE